MGYLIPKPWGRKTLILFYLDLEEGGDKGLHTFSIGISPKVNVTTQLEFELGYVEAVVLNGDSPYT